MMNPASSWISLLLTAALSAQTAQTARLPTGSFPAGEDNLPLASSPVRYQQWWAGSELQATLQFPARIRAMAFLAGNVLQPGSSVDIEIRMAHFGTGLPSVTFDNNLQVDNTLVLPRGVVTLVAQPRADTRVVTFNFAREFIWDGSSGIVFDLKVFGNGNNNQAYLYPCRTTVSSPGKTMRLFAPGNPSSLQRATLSQNGIGLVTEFDYAYGITSPYGAGCPGANALVPVAGTTGGNPTPPNPNWTQTLSNAAAGTSAVLLLGTSRTRFGAVTLPFDLGIIGYSGCSLLAEPLVMLGTSTTLAGSASIPVPIPGVRLRPRSLFSQWFVLDTQAPNGALSGSQGLWHVFD
ncbi:MAG: hypothetical protein R3F56_09685 [Planctomycetota bacterium]